MERHCDSDCGCVFSKIRSATCRTKLWELEELTCEPLLVQSQPNSSEPMNVGALLEP